METKEQLINTIRSWVKLDNDIKKLQKEQNKMKNEKKILSNSLIEIMKKNEIDCFDINGGCLVYKQNKVKKPINAKSLIATLKTYFSSNPNTAEEVTKFILDNREEQIKEVIKRKVDK